MTVQLIQQPESNFRLGDFLNEQLLSNRWNIFYAAVAFAKKAGVQMILNSLINFAKKGKIRISIGIDHKGTSAEALTELLTTLPNSEIWIFHNPNQHQRPTFHPKVYLFANQDEALLVVSSGNLTVGGFYTNYEASLSYLMDLKKIDDLNLYNNVIDTLNKWADPASGLVQPLTQDLLEELVRLEMVHHEEKEKTIEDKEKEEYAIITDEGSKAMLSLFRPREIPSAPMVQKKSIPETIEEEMPAESGARPEEKIIPVPTQTGHYQGFVMTLQKTDVGKGQTTPGTQRRSPEIFIPLAALKEDFDFWGWPSKFTFDFPDSAWTKASRSNIPIYIGGEIISATFFAWREKHDLRLRSEAIRSAGQIGDILRVERTDGKKGFQYYIEIIPQGTKQYQDWIKYCIKTVRNSLKKWGYY